MEPQLEQIREQQKDTFAVSSIASASQPDTTFTTVCNVCCLSPGFLI